MVAQSAQLGSLGEDLVKRHYQRSGYKLIASNYKLFGTKQLGEIDLIFRRRKEIIFVEVKARSNTRFADPAEYVHRAKQERLVRTAKSFLVNHPQYRTFNARIDVVIVKKELDKSLIIDSIITDAVQDLT